MTLDNKIAILFKNFINKFKYEAGMISTAAVLYITSCYYGFPNLENFDILLHSLTSYGLTGASYKSLKRYKYLSVILANVALFCWEIFEKYILGFVDSP